MVSYSRVRQTALSTLMTAPKSPLFFSIFFRIEALFCHFRLSTFYLILHPPSSQLLVVFRSILIISLHPLECLSLSLFGVDAFLFFQFLSFRHFDVSFSFALCFLNFIRWCLVSKSEITKNELRATSFYAVFFNCLPFGQRTMVWKWLNLRQNLKIDNNDYNEYNNKEKKFKKRFFFIFRVFICKKVIFNNSRLF